MKNILACLLLGFFLKPPVSQFNGVLHYEIDYNVAGSVGKVLTTIYETDSKVRVESKNIQTKSSLGQPGTKDQNVLLFDFDKQQETHLQASFKRAVVTPYTEVVMQEEKMLESMGTTVTVQKLGNEKVGNYNCTHFVITSVNTKFISKANTSKRDIWITRDLGSSRLWYVGPYLYYHEGTFFQKKLSDAGADGVVVKWQSGSGELLTTCMLMSSENKSLPATTFTPPSDYVIVHPDMSQPQRN
jgi:hypothetical protein